jgi:uncharacterized protein (DUF1778 family)
MKRITIDDLPKVFSEDILNILVEMALEEPKQTFDWRDISIYLSEKDPSQLMMILDKVDERKKAIERAKEDAKSDEQKQVEEEQRKKFYENLDPFGFYGNMGEPETPQQYKDRYGVWPPNFDERK